MLQEEGLDLPQKKRERAMTEYRTFLGAGIAASLLLFSLYHGLDWVDVAPPWQIWLGATALCSSCLLIIVLARRKMSTVVAIALGCAGWSLAVLQAIWISRNI